MTFIRINILSLSAIAKQHKIAYRSLNSNDSGRVSEWPMEHAWKVCVRLSVPRVRIPPLPPDTRKPAYAGFFVSAGRGGIDSQLSTTTVRAERQRDHRSLGS